jgi:tripartite-type tricarboxylate transporter receptor subunit TctC
MLKYFFKVALPIAAMAGMAAPAQADDISGFYRDNQITAISGGGAGGGFSFVARVLGRHMAGKIPGKPSWIVTAMPGAGGARSIKYIVNAAAQDGTVIGAVLPPSILSPLLRRNVGYDSARLQWIGSVTAMSSVMVSWHTSPIKTLEDVKKMESTTATSSKLSSGYLFPAWLNATVGTRFKVIPGYRGADRQNAAMETGEVNGRSSFYNSFVTTKPHWLRDKKIRILAYMGPKQADLANVPYMMDLMKTDEQREIGGFLQTGSQVGNGFFVAPAVPRARMMALRAAFNKTVSDPVFLADAKKRNMVVAPVRGEELDAIVEKAMNTSPALVDKFKKMVKIDKLKPRKKKKK